MRVTKRRMLLGVAGVLTTLMISAPVAAGGSGTGGVDVNDCTRSPHCGLVRDSDGGERNINFYGNFPQGSSGNVKIAFAVDELLEFNPNVGGQVRIVDEEASRHP